MTVQDRLRLVRGTLSYREFAARVKSNTNSARRYELGLSRVPVDYVEAVCRGFGISSDWLLFGIEAKSEAPTQTLPHRGNSRSSAVTGAVPPGENGRSRRGAASRRKNVESRRYTLIDGEKVRIVCVPVLTYVPAGPPLEMLDVTPVGFGLEGEVWVPDPDDENAYGLTAQGNSMEPLIYDGETIIVSPRRRYDFTSGTAVVRIPKDEVCVKYVRRGVCSVEVISANPRYPRMVFRPDEAEILGEVVQVVRTERRGN